MKRIPRDPEKFEVLDLFSAIGQKRDLKLYDEDSVRSFVKSIETSLGRNKTPINLHGRRIEAMFGYVAASLGGCAVIKKEDSGEIFLESTDAKVPDYRIVTRTGEQFLVEVKNCHKTDPLSKYSIKAAYLERLKRYASLFELEVKLAIYWSRWNKWVLVSPSDLKPEASVCVTSFIDSYKQNQMATLGDVTIGTTPPLILHILTDPDKPRRVCDDGQVAFTIGQVELSCAGRFITKEDVQNIALYLMFYGDWPIAEPRAHIKNRELVAIEFSAEPVEATSDQGFNMVGTMSSMISRRYNELTAPEGQVERLAPRVEPGSLGITIPTYYKGSELLLWRFIQQPATSGNRER